MKQNSRKFLKGALENDIRIFESVAGNSLDNLGYERLFAKEGRKLNFGPDDIRRFDIENQKLKDEVSNTSIPPTWVGVTAKTTSLRKSWRAKNPVL